MKDILEYSKFFDQVSATISDLESKVLLLKGDQYLGKIARALEEDPENNELISQKTKN